MIGGVGDHTGGTPCRVVGRVVARNVAGISIRGLGILQEPDESSGPHALEASADFYTIEMDACANMQVEGITLREIPRGWTSRYNECDHLAV